MHRSAVDAAREDARSPTGGTERRNEQAGQTDPPGSLATLHESVGNRAVGRLLDAGPATARSTASQPGSAGTLVIRRQEADGEESKPGKAKSGKSGKTKSGKSGKAKPGKSGKSKPKQGGSKLPKELEKTAESVNDYVLDHYGKLIDGALKRSSIADRIRYYDSKDALVKAKYDFAREAAGRIVARMSKGEKAKRKKASSVINSDADIRRTIVPQVFAHLGGRNVPAFTDTQKGVIHTSSDGAVLLAHEILHYYSSTSNFRRVFGSGLDEGMTQYLAKEVYYGYRKAKKEEEAETEDSSGGGIRSRPRFDSEPPDPIPISDLSAYSDQVAVVERIIESGVKEKTLEKAYFGGKPGLLKKLDQQTKPIREQVRGTEGEDSGSSTGKDGQDAGAEGNGKPSGDE